MTRKQLAARNLNLSIAYVLTIDLLATGLLATAIRPYVDTVKWNITHERPSSLSTLTCYRHVSHLVSLYPGQAEVNR
jgi:uncharacterized membrane protein